MKWVWEIFFLSKNLSHLIKIKHYWNRTLGLFALNKWISATFTVPYLLFSLPGASHPRSWYSFCLVLVLSFNLVFLSYYFALVFSWPLCVRRHLQSLFQFHFLLGTCRVGLHGHTRLAHGLCIYFYFKTHVLIVKCYKDRLSRLFSIALEPMVVMGGGVRV